MPAPVTPVRQRTQYTCTASSLSMALKALGLQDCGEDKVNEVLGAAPMRGAAWEQVAAAANHYGCRSTLVVPSTLAQVKSWTDAGKPVLIGWNPEDRPWSHASLIYDVTDTHVFVADPNCPDPLQTVRELPHADFYRKWSEEWNGYKVRRPAMLIDREVDADGRQVMASRRKASSQPLSLRYDYGYKKDLQKGTSKLPEDVILTAGDDMAQMADETMADSDGSYMSVGYLKALADKSEHLLDHIDNNSDLPDWVEAKISQAANAINGVHDYFEYRGDDSEEDEMSLVDNYTLLPQMLTAKFEEGKSVDVPKYLEEHGNPEAAKEWVEQNEANKDKFKSAGRKVAVDLPAEVEGYVEEIKKSNPTYDDAQAWATAWSIYCKYKEPGSEHCQLPTSEYFKAAGRKAVAAAESLEAAWGDTLACEAEDDSSADLLADWEEGHVGPQVSGPHGPRPEEGSDTPDGMGNLSKRAEVTIGKGKNTYLAQFKGKKVVVKSDTQYGAQQEAAAYFKAKKGWEVAVGLLEVEGKPYAHAPVMAGAKTADESLFADLFADMSAMAEGCPDNLDEAGCEEWEANTEKYKDVVKDQYKSAAGAKRASRKVAFFDPDFDELEPLRDDLVKALVKKGVPAKKGATSSDLYVEEGKYTIYAYTLEGPGLSRRSLPIMADDREEWLKEAVMEVAKAYQKGLHKAAASHARKRLTACGEGGNGWTMLEVSPVGTDSEPQVVMAEGLEDACWEDYEAIGMKEQGGKMVPNCVPKQAKGQRKAGMDGNHYVGPNNKVYVDSNFLNLVGKVPGVSLEHMGFGEFYADTPKGRVDFDRMRGVPFEGQVGRSHQMYGEGGAEKWLLAEMAKRGLSEESVGSTDVGVGYHRSAKLKGKKANLPTSVQGWLEWEE